MKNPQMMSKSFQNLNPIKTLRILQKREWDASIGFSLFFADIATAFSDLTFP